MKKYFLYDLCIASDIELMLFDNICRLPDNTPCEVTVHMNDYIPEELEKLNANYTIVSNLYSSLL